jgi:Tfp pilus assembly protein PilO
MRRLAPPAVVTAALVPVVLLVVLALVIVPMRSTSARLDRAAAELRGKIAQADAMYRQLPAMQQQVVELQKRIDSLSRSQANPTPDVVREIGRLTLQYGLRLSSIRPAEPQTGDTYTKYTTTFEVQSRLDNLVRLLYELEQPPYNLWVEGVEIGTEQGSSAGLRATVMVAVYTGKTASRPTDEKA